MNSRSEPRASSAAADSWGLCVARSAMRPSGRAMTLPTGNLRLARAVVHISDEGRVRRCNDEAPLLARPLQCGVHHELPLLFERFVVTGQELIDKRQRRLWQLVRAVAALPRLGKQASNRLDQRTRPRVACNSTRSPVSVGGPAHHVAHE